MLNLSPNVKISRVSALVAAGTGDTQVSTGVDMQGWDGVLFIVPIGAIVATGTADVLVSQSADDVTYNDLEGSKVSFVADDADKMAVIEVYRPQDRYVRVEVDRATANVTIDGVIAIRYKGRKAPVVNDASIKGAKLLASPAEGTA